MLNTPFSPWPSFSEEEANAVISAVAVVNPVKWLGKSLIFTGYAV